VHIFFISYSSFVNNLYFLFKRRIENNVSINIYKKYDAKKNSVAGILFSKSDRINGIKNKIATNIFSIPNPRKEKPVLSGKRL
jgi:hypothetical protein